MIIQAMPYPVGGGGTDPHFANTILLLSGDGVNGSQSFVDESFAARGDKLGPVSGSGSVDTSKKVFGTGSIHFSFTGEHIQYGDHADFDVGSDDFTIEFWVNLADVSGTRAFFAKHNASNSNKGYVLQFNGTSNTLTFFGASSGGGSTTAIASGSWDPTADTWYFVCAERSGNTFRVYVGQAGGTATMVATGTNSMTIFNNASAFRISGQGSEIEEFYGNLDEFRFTRGVARYANDAGFAVPSAAFPRSGEGLLPHRYWRVNIAANGGSTSSSIVELEMYESEFGQNVCAGGVAAASSELSAGEPFTAARAFDGSLDDGGTSSEQDLWAGNTASEWLSYDFGGGNEKAVSAIGMHGRQSAFADQMPTDFAVEYSDNGTDWFQAWSESGLTWAAFEFKRFVNPSYSEPVYSGSPHGAHSHWRIYVNQTSVAAIAITEAEFRATSGGADQATGGTAAASSTFSGSFPASAAFDNNTSTFWHNGSGLEFGWLRYDFASAVDVAELMLRARASGSPIAGPENVFVQYADSTSGPWTTAWAIQGETGWTLGEVRSFADPHYV